MSTADAASVILNILAFVGAGAFLLFHADERRRSPVDTRLAGVFVLLMALVAVRSTRWALDLYAMRRVEEALAAAMPLAALVLAEGLMRRHAPMWMKRIFLGGGIVYALVALTRPPAFNMAFVIALGVFVAGGLLITIAALFWVQWAHAVLFAVMVLVASSVLIYSYLEWKQEQPASGAVK